MVKWFNRKPSSILGVDISSTSVKMLAISSNANGKSCVEGYGCKFLPVIEGETNPVKEINAVTNCLKELLLQSHFPGNTAVIALPDSLVISKIIQLSATLTPTEIEEAVLIEADNYVAHPLDEVNVDFNILGHCKTKPTMLDVLMIAAKAEHVGRRIEAVSRAGLRVKIVDVESYAVERSLQLIAKELPLLQGKIVVLINIGVSLIHFFVSDGSQTLFKHEEIFGGRQFFELIRKHYGVSYEQGLRMQILPEDYEIKVIQPFAEILLVQMQKILQFISSLGYQSAISHILLAGCIAGLDKLAVRLQEKTAIPTQLVNPLHYLAISNDLNSEVIVNMGPSLMVACGLALRQRSGMLR